MSLFDELRRRNVFRVAAAYLVVGWLLTEVLTTILPTLGAPDWTSRAVILIFAFGFVPAIVVAWFFELTPDGLKRDHEVERSAEPGDRRRRTLDYVTIAGVVVLIVFLGLFSARQSGDVPRTGAPPVSQASVAVLPFVNMSRDEDNEYFSDGLTETLLHMLTQIPDLKVAARTSSFAFKGKNAPVGEIARTLGVAHVLEGSVQRVGDRVRITAQLIRAADGFHLWSEVYDRTLDDIFAIQDEIAGEVGTALSASLLDTPARPAIAGVSTADADAFDLYLQALNERAKYSYGGLQAAEDLLKGALTIDPDFLEAKKELAYNYLAQVETGLKGEDDAFGEILAITDQVLAANPDDAGARALRRFAEAMLAAKAGDGQAVFAAIDELEGMLAAEPDDLKIRTLLVRMFKGTKQPERALDVMQTALGQDPLNAQIHYELGALYADLERRDAARAALTRALEIEPQQPNAYAILAGIGLQENDGVEYMRQMLKAIAVDPKDHELPGIVASLLYELELVEEGDDFRNRVLATAPTSEIAHRIELLRAIARGDEEQSVAVARRAIEADVEDRRFAFGGAVQHLLQVATRQGTVAAEFDYLEREAPGILDIENDATPLKYRSAQYTAFDAWYTTLTPAALDAQIEKMLEIARSYGFDPKSDPETRVALLALRGRTEAAIDVALDEVFTEPVAMHLGWERAFGMAQYREFVADPRVRAAMARWEAEEAALREDVRSFLADLQAST
ncbi:MAG: tetratricopeptide repeat protein [Woeseiaceae bacterium]|nr:tetratricopeptide repeat protein [Woeseiaceae bacterium]